MNDRGFHWFKKSWYASPRNSHTIAFGLYTKSGRKNGEMTMRWIEFEDGQSAPKLECFDDAWSILAGFHDVMVAIGKAKENITQEEFIEILLQYDFKDMTEYEMKQRLPEVNLP